VEVGTVRQIDISREVQAAYLDYAMSVIVARALPDVRDGLKPVHRRILYAMHDMGLAPDKPYRKSARIVGEVLGKYHPHGDAAVYESMVRMAQDFSMRYLLVDGQGNFGSIDGDEAAAMRYTEARLHAAAMTMLADIEKGTVPFGPNFDGTLQEPLVLPSALPNFLVNGAAGIAVGMATSVPPHNLSEVCDALCYMIERYERVEEIAVEELMQFIQGPDFPTGGIVYRYEQDGTEGAVDVIKAAYAVGRGRFTVQARAHLEEMSRNRSRIVVTELPYQVNKTRLIERIAELAREGRLDGLADLRDESDRQGMRLVIELTRTVEPKEVLAKLFKLTPMQSTFSVNILALVDGEPRTLSLKRALWHYLEHRREMVTRRSQFELEQARRQAHILEGLLIALDNLDAVIATIRQSQNAETARANLMRKFKLTEVQAQAILDMQLRRLAALEQKKIRQDYQEKLARIAYLEDLLGSPRKILHVVGEELRQLKETYGDARRTQLVARPSEIILAGDLVEEESVVVWAAEDKIWREPRAGATPPHRDLQAGVCGPSTGDLALFTADGRGVLTPLHQTPRGAEAAVGLGELLNSNVSAAVVAALILPGDLRRAETPAGYLFLVSAQGRVKRSTLADFYAVAGRGLTPVMGIESPDRLIAAFCTEGTEEIFLMTAGGQAIRFDQEEVRPMGLPAAGVAGVKLDEGDEVAAAALGRPAAELLIMTGLGHGKRTPLGEYPKQKRYGGGVASLRVTPRTGRVMGGAVATAHDALFVLTAAGQALPLAWSQIPEVGRVAAGKAMLRLPANVQFSRLVVVEGGLGAAAPPTPQAAPAEKRSPKGAGEAHQLAMDLDAPAPQEAILPTAKPAKSTSRKASKPASPEPAKAPRRTKADAPADAARPATTPVSKAKAGQPKPAPANAAAPKSRSKATSAPEPPAEKSAAKPARQPKGTKEMPAEVPAGPQPTGRRKAVQTAPPPAPEPATKAPAGRGAKKPAPPTAPAQKPAPASRRQKAGGAEPAAQPAAEPVAPKENKPASAGTTKKPATSQPAPSAPPPARKTRKVETPAAPAVQQKPKTTGKTKKTG